MKRTADDIIGGKEKQVKLSADELYKAPTSNELQHIESSEKPKSLAQADLLQLQISELLSEVSIKVSRRKLIDEFILKLTDKLKSLESSDSYQLPDESWVKKIKVKVPLPAAPSRLKGNFRFRPPDDVQVIGSYATDTCTKPRLHVDVAVTLPKGFVHAKDRLNQAYYRKRALYLTCIAGHLANWAEGVADLSFLRHHGNHMTPVLALKPKGKLGSHVEVRIHTSFEEHHVKHVNLHLARNNVRSTWFHSRTGDTEISEANGNDTEDPPTPHYNTGILTDMTVLHNSELLEMAFKDAPGVRGGIKLLKVWLRQRELNQGYGAMSGFIVSMYVLYLMRQGKLHQSMAAFQAFRDTLTQLAQVKWCEKGITLCTEKENSTLPSLEEFHMSFGVVFVDDTGFVNLCAAMSAYTLKRVKYLASMTMKIIETSSTSAFELLFMKPVPFLMSCDQILMFNNINAMSKTVDKLSLTQKLVDRSGHALLACKQNILELVEKAIGRRVKLITHSFPSCQKWTVTDNPPGLGDDAPWMIGFLLEPDTANTILEKGPSADTPEALAFREFWGDKSELRRFQDGSICEAVVWPCDNAQQRRGVLLEIVRYCLARHADIAKKDTRVIHDQLDFLLKQHEQVAQATKSQDEAVKSPPPGKPPRRVLSAGTGEEDMTEHAQAYSHVCAAIRRLTLPLTITAIHATTPHLRYTEVFPVKAATFSCVKNTSLMENHRFPSSKSFIPPYVPIPTVVCVLEGSGAWPDDAVAVTRMKAALLAQVARQLSATNVTVHATPSHVHVMLSGYAFRLQLGYSYEIQLLKRRKTDDGRIIFEDTESAKQLQRQLHLLPPLSSTLVGLHHTFPSFSNGVRLAKRWVASQMLLADHVPEEAVELIVASLYLQPQPYPTPGSSLTCFLRFLQFLSTFDWKLQPLLVNLNDEFKPDDYEEITKHFAENRATLPVMFIATPTDKLTSQWTSLARPSAPVLTRLALLARQALPVLRAQLLGAADPLVNFKQIFRPPLDAFDVVIHLKAKMVTRGYQAIDISKHTLLPDYSKLEKSQVKGIPVVDFDPVQCYLRDIREAFGQVGLFFYDQYGGQAIGMLWKPYACGNKPFSEDTVNYHMADTTSSDIQLVPNAESIIEDLRILGDGLVADVETRTQNWPF